MRIAIVDDMRMTVEILRRIISTKAPHHEIAWVAYNGKEAVEKCLKDTPDILLMDLVMPVMNGADATREIMAKCPCCILVVTSSVAGNSAKVFEAMSHGALDAVNTPALGPQGDMEGAALFLQKLERIEILSRNSAGPQRKPAQIPALPAGAPADTPFLVAIGASTGGPAALAQLLAELPHDFRAATVIVQHIDKEFAAGLADWLGTFTKLKLLTAAEGDSPAPGKVYLASSNDHLVVTPEMKFKYSADPIDQPFRPSVDVFFDSICRHWPRKGAAVLLTGIGRDGAAGLLALKNNGWLTIAQDKASCVVYGMPKAAAELEASSMTLPPIKIGQELAKLRF